MDRTLENDILDILIHDCDGRIAVSTLLKRLRGIGWEGIGRLEKFRGWLIERCFELVPTPRCTYVTV